MKINRLLYLIPLIVVLLASCGKQQTHHLKIVCTSDVHANFFPYDFLTDESASGSLARVSTYLNELRAASAYGDNVVYIDNGDILQGQPTAYYYNTVAIEREHLAAEALNYLQCDVVGLGNHDIETGGPTYQRYMRDLKCPAVGGNIYFEETEHPFLPPYVVIERGGLKIAFMGLTTPAIPHWLPRSLWQGLEFGDMEQAARRWMVYLREHETPDLVIGLFHSGTEGGIVTDDYAENATRAVAEKVPGFDAIFYGHVHKAENTKVVNVEGDTVLLINPANNANKVATLDVQYRKGKDGIMAISAELVEMNGYEPDKAYMEAFAPHMDRVKGYVSKKIGTLTHAIDSREAYFGPSRFMDFIHRMQLDVTKAQVSFAAPLSYDAIVPEGDICVRDMFNLYRYENMLYVMHLSGQEIKDYLEMSYAQWANQMKHPDDHLLLFAEDRVGQAPHLEHIFSNFDSAAGILYEVDVLKPIGQRIRIKSMADGTPFRLDEYYRVALNSYRGTGGGELLTKGAGIPHDQLERRIIQTTDIDLRFYMLSYIEMRGEITPPRMNEWKFVPERWTVPAAQRDYTLLFGK